MSFFCRLSGKHYWSIPHRSADKRLVQVCYECGAERPIPELRDEIAIERFNHALASAKAEVSKLSTSPVLEEAIQRSTQERIAMGQRRTGNLLLLK
jgi:hypothetical protein